MSDLKPGSRWKSMVCDTEAVLVRPPKSGAIPECGGVAMQPSGSASEAGAIAPGFDGGSELGKRYVDPVTGMEMLCVKGGGGSLGVEGRMLDRMEAKKLPSSD
jgi:hypothetical protein